jgi:FAD/FMN-containing dehydrogenase
MLRGDDHAALTAIVGEQAVLTGAAMAGYETPARYESGRAAAVVRPASTEQVAAVVRHCVRNELPFVPQSGNTGLVSGSTPDITGTQVVLSLDRLRAPLQVNVENRSAHVGAGVRLSALNAALEPHDLFLPIDLGADPMIGGMISTNTAGARFLRYGDMRRHVLGLQVVLADPSGTILDLRSGLRKDNTGVDFRQLFIGTAGAFGIVTQAVLDVQPRPTDTATAIVIPADVRDAPMALLRFLERYASDSLTAFEGMSRNAMAAALAHAPGLASPFGDAVPEYAVLIELSANATLRGQGVPLEDRLTLLLGQAAEDSLIVDAVVGRGQQLWSLRHSISEGLRRSGYILGFDLAFERGAVLPFRNEMIPALATRFPQYQVCDFGHLGDGGVHFSLVRPRTATSTFDAAVSDYVFDFAVQRFGGSFSGEHGIGRANQRMYDRYTSPLRQQLASGIATLIAQRTSSAVRFGPAQALTS